MIGILDCLFQQRDSRVALLAIVSIGVFVLAVRPIAVRCGCRLWRPSARANSAMRPSSHQSADRPNDQIAPLQAALVGLKRSEESLRLLFVSNPLPMWVFDRETLCFLAVNEAAIAHYGYSLAQFLTMTIVDFQRPEDREALRLAAKAPNGAYWNDRIARHIKANGEEVEVAIYSRVLDYQGRPASMVAGVDITPSRRAEAELRRTREFLNTIIENVPAPIIVKDARSFRHILVNRATEKFLGIPRARILGENMASFYEPESAACVRERDRTLITHRKELFYDEHPFKTPGNGVRYITSKGLPIFDDNAEPLYLLTVIDDVTERKLANERIAHLTSHDMLTGLPNRAVFGQRMIDELSQSDRQGVAALCIDIDRFKEINDEFGHVFADRILEAVAHRLQLAVGVTFLARVGGDEFNLIVSDAEQPEGAVEVADRVFLALADEIEIDGSRVKVSVSIGIAIFPADGADATILIANAEAALHAAKQEKRGVMRFFEANMDRRLRERRTLERELRSAVEMRQLRIHYQPQTNVAGDLLGFEALARWQHPTRGSVSPSVFIPIAEESGIIIPMGEWILREACREAAAWPHGLSIAVNLSPIQLRHGELFTLVRNTLIETGLAGNRLELEITEGVLIGDSASALAILRSIKTLGVRIAMDDFGTGYSSLSYFQSFPFDKIKTDRSFIANVDHNHHSAAIIRAILGLAHGLHLPVVAEGVETEDQLAFLRREGCDEIQGYLMGRPRPIEEYAAWIACGGPAPPRLGSGEQSALQAVALSTNQKTLRAREGAIAR
jgi:diguanylate cyclase (GGDEF)-like protein/PAS domain S-box-containing protein